MLFLTKQSHPGFKQTNVSANIQTAPEDVEMMYNLTLTSGHCVQFSLYMLVVFGLFQMKNSAASLVWGDDSMKQSCHDTEVDI